MKNAFTLIELLVVVAIIGILASIAIPNFLCAQIKAKIARTQADHKAIATALEMYRMDENAYPNAYDESSGEFFQRLNKLTTPVAYMASVPGDPFFKRSETQDENFSSTLNKDGVYLFWDPDYTDSAKENTNLFIYLNKEKERRGNWILHGAGPDADYEAAENQPLQFYNATNGCIGNGDIYRFTP